MVLESLPDKYRLFNQYTSKNLVIIVEIEGVDLLSNIAIYEKYRYGDPGLDYGDPGVVYGGLRRVEGQRDLLSLDGGLTISQKIEPEQGRGAISTLTLPFIDKDKYITQVCTPGLIIPDILGRKVKVWLGYQQISYPEDYFVIFRGVITAVDAGAGLIRLQMSDSNIKRKGNIFYTAITQLASGISDSDTTIPVVSNTDFHRKIIGPDGTYFPGVKCYVRIGDEYIEYQQTGQEGVGFGSNQFVNVLRGQRGTIAEAHDPDSDVEAAIEIQDHGVDMALSHMLSGWNGPYREDIPIRAIVTTPDVTIGDLAGAIILDPDADAVEDFGLAVGDYLTISGDPNPANNVTVRIVSFDFLFDKPNQIINTDGALVSSLSSPAVFSVRSQYDKYPISCGSKLAGDEVDVATHQQLKNFFLAQQENTFRFFVKGQQSCKTWLESQVYLPMVCYSLTKFGRLSMGYTKPPFADQRLQILDIRNILNAKDLKVQRATNNRKFFNQIDYFVDANDEDKFTNVVRTFDSESVSVIGINSTLPLKTLGSRTDLGFDIIKERRTLFLLQRYKDGAVMINPKVNFEVGCQIEAGDVVALKDDGSLQLSNFGTGERDMGTQLFEVIDRTLDTKDGNVQLMLLGGLQGAAVDRYGSISPSSKVDAGSTASRIRIKDSYGAIFPNQERRKWSDYVGLKIRVHNQTYSQSAETTIVSLDPADDYAFFVAPALPFTPTNDVHTVDIIEYPDNTDKTDQALYKVVHAYIDPSVVVTAGISQTQFQVALADVAKFQVDFPVQVHNADSSLSSPLSPDILVTDVTGVTITVDTPLGFIPAAGHIVELIGFPDGQGPYRWL